MTDKHPDLMALSEGRLDAAGAADAQAHIDACGECAAAAKILAEAVSEIDRTAAMARSAFADDDALAFEADQWLGSADEEDMAVLEVAADDVVRRLPSELKREVAKLDQGSLGARLRRSVEKLTGLGSDAARDLADRLGSGAMPSAAPAIRKDATKVEDDETSGDNNQDENQEQ